MKLQDRFSRALDQFHAAPLHKLIRPGMHKFARRCLARKNIFNGVVRVPLFFEQSMDVVLPEVVSEVIYTYGFFDEEVTAMVLQAVQAGDVVVDIGAHFGYFTLLFSHIAGPAGRVLSFEPTPSTFAILKQNVAGNANCEIFNVAAGDMRANLEITDFGLQHCAWNTLAVQARLPDLMASRALKKVDVEVVALDAFLAEKNARPTFIKIDAENFEENVIKGLLTTICRRATKILMETGSDCSLNAGSLLMAAGLRPHVLGPDRKLTACHDEWAVANFKYKDILFLP